MLRIIGNRILFNNNNNLQLQLQKFCSIYPFKPGMVHYLLLIVTLPVSFYALHLGLKNHEKKGVFALGIAGLVLFVLAVIFGEAYAGETGEQVVTVIASLLVIYAHYQNYQICRKLECSSCHSSVAEK